MTLHCYTLTYFTSNICSSSSDVYAVVRVLCINSLDCGDAVARSLVSLPQRN